MWQIFTSSLLIWQPALQLSDHRLLQRHFILSISTLLEYFCVRIFKSYFPALPTLVPTEEWPNWIESTDPFIVWFPPNVDAVAKVLDEDEHDLVVVVPPVVSDVKRRVVRCLARKEGSLVHFHDKVVWPVRYSRLRCILNTPFTG